MRETGRDPNPSFSALEEEDIVVEILPPQPGETDAQRMMREGQRYQQTKQIVPPGPKLPSFRPFVLLAIVLVLISVGIELFWPIPGMHGPLPACPEGAVTTSCQRG